MTVSMALMMSRCPARVLKRTISQWIADIRTVNCNRI